MRALILEDDGNRIRQFKQRMLEMGWVADYVDTAPAAIKLLREKKYDIIFLDHDLGGEVYVNTSRPDTGSEVARYIAVNPVSCPVILHTLNVPGADYMKDMIPQAIHVPFVWKEK